MIQNTLELKLSEWPLPPPPPQLSLQSESQDLYPTMWGQRSQLFLSPTSKPSGRTWNSKVSHDSLWPLFGWDLYDVIMMSFSFYPLSLASPPAAGDSQDSLPPLCPYAAAGQCFYGNDCTYLHGDLCEVCGRQVLHPHNPEQRRVHEKVWLSLDYLNNFEQEVCSSDVFFFCERFVQDLFSFTVQE